MAELGEALSERELDVLRSIVNGTSNKEVAAELTISQNTVKVHLRNIYTKLGVSSRTEAARVAFEQGIVALPGSEPDAATVAAPVAVAAVETAPVAAFPPRRWLLLALLLALLLLLALAVALALPLFRGDKPAPAAFAERELGDTRWLVSRPLPEARARAAAAAFGLDVFYIGGETEAGISDEVDIYDTGQLLWRSGAAKPTAVADTTADVLFGEIYVPGGRLASGQPTDIVEAYSPTQGAWRSIAALPQPVAGGLTISDGSFLYLFGGWNGVEYLDTAYVYDPGADSWRPLPPLARPQAFAAGAAVTGQLYVVGGFDGDRDLASCQFFDIAAESWQPCPDLLQPRAGAGAAVLLNRLYVVGGGLDTRQKVEYSEVYDPNSGVWQVVNTPLLAETPNWTEMGVVGVEARIYVLGGEHAGAILDDTYVYAPLVYRTFIPAASSDSGN